MDIEGFGGLTLVAAAILQYFFYKRFFLLTQNIIQTGMRPCSGGIMVFSLDYVSGNIVYRNSVAFTEVYSPLNSIF